MTAVCYFHRLRDLIYRNDDHGGLMAGEIEVDESYFGGKRKGKRGRGASGKVPVFALRVIFAPVSMGFVWSGLPLDWQSNLPSNLRWNHTPSLETAAR